MLVPSLHDVWSRIPITCRPVHRARLRDPRLGGKQLLAQSLLKQSAYGARPFAFGERGRISGRG